MSRKLRVSFFIDGFNLYHFIKNNKLKWLDFVKLAKTLLPSYDVVFVKYFTARATWHQQKTQRHDWFIMACEHMGVEVIVKKFQEKEKKFIMENKYGFVKTNFFKRNFRACIHKGYTHEEKQTDVAIGVSMYRDAKDDNIDVIALISGDTDFIPALELIREDFPSKKIIVFIPANKNIYRIPPELRRITGSSGCRFLKRKILGKCLLPPEIDLVDGSILRCPEKWQ